MAKIGTKCILNIIKRKFFYGEIFRLLARTKGNILRGQKVKNELIFIYNFLGEHCGCGGKGGEERLYEKLPKMLHFPRF